MSMAEARRRIYRRRGGRLYVLSGALAVAEQVAFQDSIIPELLGVWKMLNQTGIVGRGIVKTHRFKPIEV